MLARAITSSTKLSDVVRTASDEPPEYAIEPHSEYHTAGLPHKIALFAHGEVPEYGGEWMVADTRRIMEELDKEVVRKFDELGACYRVFYESRDNSVIGYNNWQTNINCDKEKVEEYLRIRGYDWKWNDDASLEYWKVYPAVVPHPVTGEKCWFNQVHAQHKSFYYSHPKYRDLPRDSNRFPVNTTYGDGTEIEPEVLAHIRSIIWRNCHAAPLRTGALLVQDNYLTLHGRSISIGCLGRKAREAPVSMQQFGLHLAKLCCTSSTKKEILQCAVIDRISRVVEVKIREHVTASTGKGLVLKPRTVSKLALTLAQLEQAYWMDFVKYKEPEMSEAKCRSDLIWLEKKMAYGISAAPTNTPNRYKLHLVALPSREVFLTVDKEGRPRAETTYKGKRVYLLRIYVEAKENLIGVPTVKWVNVHCLDPETGREVVEKIKP
ncbi:conserved hypothetical protein [Perkinsus marinus ATCC 50983]|uniref:TauD/TfdA-like domain-containing protein n=1 Tax=Perkinsus marinus (strain ATCC 50983 / TXsc) TaxID=423536 RepID=C5K6N9_PERM5|nr:conserved hypothetical protein [Perkinsus marinus ATCC 50983]EER19959.1 conserved hypothetical protein [Perkinsus marinus ATCC 50983]|eukprot:XP_002788163.1 conserved hypothetical protein [Perkinsus marinus ATCC 50983]